MGLVVPSIWFLQVVCIIASDQLGFKGKKACHYLNDLIFFHISLLCFIWKLSSSVLSLLCLPALENFFSFQQRSAKWQVSAPICPTDLSTCLLTFPRQ